MGRFLQCSFFPVVELRTATETMGKHKRLLVLAEHFSANGIAALRLDDRGIGGSEGSLANSTLTDLAEDAHAALGFLAQHPNIDPEALGILGGSQGSIVASLVAANNPMVRFLAVLSPPGIPGKDLLVDQQVRLARASGASEESQKEIRQGMSELVDLAASWDDAAPRARRDREQMEAIYLSVVEHLPGPPRLRQTSLRQEAYDRVSQLLSPLFALGASPPASGRVREGALSGPCRRRRARSSSRAGPQP